MTYVKNDILTWIKAVKGYRLYKLDNAKLLLSLYLSNKSQRRNTNGLKEVFSWLCIAQDVTECGGVSAGYLFQGGWAPAYPETTGYLVETFYDYSQVSGLTCYKDRAQQMVEWLTSVQMNSGAFQGESMRENPKPVVFNTGMVLFGLLRAYIEENDKKYLSAAIKAGDWLVEIQDYDGAWRKNTYLNQTHVYKTRVAWALLQLWQISGASRYSDTALKNLDWAMNQQIENGYFRNMAFDKEPPFTHTIAYTIRGFLESGLLLNNMEYVDAALKGAEKLLQHYVIYNDLAGQFDDLWEAVSEYSCLTGSAQVSLIWLRIYHMNGDDKYLNAALKMNDFLKRRQIRAFRNPEINGAIMGSYPIWGNYMPFSFPNWAAKFYADALMEEENLRFQR